ncbi:MAG: hypothetical protein ACJ72T_06410 [Nitrososphaeraceae archaeon]
MCIVTGHGIDLAIALIDRMKKMFAGSNKGLISFDTKETVIELNNAKIEAFPSHHLDAMCGLPNVSFILLEGLTSSLQDSSKMLEMFPRGTLQNQIPTL